LGSPQALSSCVKVIGAGACETIFNRYIAFSSTPTPAGPLSSTTASVAVSSLSSSGLSGLVEVVSTIFRFASVKSFAPDGDGGSASPVERVSWGALYAQKYHGQPVVLLNGTL